ncbi:MAG: hypothetical protein Q9187_004918 [Circinaria calcarea]
MPVLTSLRNSRVSEPATSEHETHQAHHDTVFMINPALFITCALTCFTLLLIGIIGKIRGDVDGLDDRRSSLGYGRVEGKTQSGLGIKALVQRLAGRLLGFGLTFFAATQLGGVRVAMVTLAAISGDLENVNGQDVGLTSLGGWKRLLNVRKWMFAAFLLQCISDFAGPTSSVGPMATISGYLAIGVSAFILPPPYSTSTPRTLAVTSPLTKTVRKTSAIAVPWETPAPVPIISPRLIRQSPMICTRRDTNLTIAAGILAAALSGLVFLALPTSPILSFVHLSWMFLVAITTTISLAMVDADSLRTGRRLGLAAGLIFSVLLQEMLHNPAFFSFVCQGVLAGFFWQAPLLDANKSSSHEYHKGHHHEHDAHHHHTTHSKFTGILLRKSQKWPLLNNILADKDSRRIFYFMSLNFSFMIVQTFYAIATGSLGLLSDSIHMLFDCLALIVGLCAAVMSKWPPSIRFPYGFGKVDTLAGFANGVFLMLISVEIFYEAIERIVEGTEVHRIEELLTVSSLGLVVNLIGMLAFGHAHHGHGHGHSHGHNHPQDDHVDDHDDEGQSHKAHGDHSAHHAVPDSIHRPKSPLSFSVPSTPSRPAAPTPHSHSSGHDHHSHGNENMQGIFLHVLADTLGSVAVVVSTILIWYTGWAGWDPLASCLIAILIFAAAIPLVTSSARRLLLTVPQDTEFDLREALAGVGALRGVSQVRVPRFWMGEAEGRKVQGVMHVVAGRGGDLEDVRERAVRYLESNGMDVLVQVEREGEGRCWCGGGMKNN